MQIVGFMEDELQSVLELVAAVLKLGNIEFKPESRCNGTDESRIKDKNGVFSSLSHEKIPDIFVLHIHLNFNDLATWGYNWAV